MSIANFIIFLAFLSIFAFGVNAQQSKYPSEMDGFKFFGEGKLSGLELGTSSREDVQKIFGQTCETKCDYDKEWTISFEYFNDIWIKESRDEKGEKLTYLLDSKYLGSVRTIRIYPKNRIPLGDASFPTLFRRLITTSTTDTRSGKSRMTVNDAFQDSDGLSYEIYSRTNYDDIKSRNETIYQKGDLVFVGYEITKENQRNMFVLQK